jgi:phosphate transport system substrate-binding protein
MTRTRTKTPTNDRALTNRAPTNDRALTRSPGHNHAVRRFLLALPLLLAACQGDAPPPAAAQPSIELAPEPDVIRAVGTGAMEPLAQALAQAWRESGGAPQVIVEPSVGSGGGVLAAADGAADLGMISRPLDADEAQKGLLVHPVARDAAVIAAHRSVAVDGLTSEALAALYAGRASRFADGQRAVVLLRDAHESANAALERIVPELGPIRRDAYAAGRLRVLYHDDAMAEALATTPGGVGVYDLGAIVTWRLPLKVLALDGVRPSVETIADGSWKATRELAFVQRPDRAERVAKFLLFVASPEGRRITRASGCVALPFAPEERAP